MEEVSQTNVQGLQKTLHQTAIVALVLPSHVKPPRHPCSALLACLHVYCYSPLTCPQPFPRSHNHTWSLGACKDLGLQSLKQCYVCVPPRNSLSLLYRNCDFRQPLLDNMHGIANSCDALLPLESEDDIYNIRVIGILRTRKQASRC